MTKEMNGMENTDVKDFVKKNNKVDPKTEPKEEKPAEKSEETPVVLKVE